MARTILVPFDGSPHARAGLEYAFETYPDAAVTVLHVVERTGELGFDDQALEAWLERVDAARADAQDVLERAEAIAAQRDRPLETALWVGRPTTAILAYTTEADVDHVVIGSRGTGDADGHLGSVADAVVHRSPVLVTVVR
ncbi:universal stress protein [Natronobiforma cellulositropha]|uniref:universal stress protein n=1 Tax=Natronobiforma cellulositropha TaxID=1679076 RepID=UPI0021D5D0DD|nr:universal stress protein [Natronobiforma cellulositropha]